MKKQLTLLLSLLAFMGLGIVDKTIVETSVASYDLLFDDGSLTDNSYNEAGYRTSDVTSYHSIIEVMDWGPVVTKLIVDLGEEVSQETLTTDTFEVFVERNDRRKDVSISSEGYRNVTNIYVSDEDGNSIDGDSNIIVLELEYGPDLTLGYAMNFDFPGTMRNDWVTSDYTITQVKDAGATSDLVINKYSEETRLLVDEFSTGEATYDDVTLTYADYAPTDEDQKNPLIIWLHGLGEGGTDPTIALAGNKVVNFITDEVQSMFGGAYVLAPQAPTLWMQGHEEHGDGSSIYQDALMNLIEDYIADNQDIDPNRVYVGGISNGGYMAMLLIRDNPDYFASSFVAAQALKDELITEEDLNHIAQTPLWMVHTMNDTTVPPQDTVLPTYERLLEVDADGHLSMYDNVIDLSGRYTNEDENPHEYNGHNSWIYLYNNHPSTTIDGEEISILEWVAAQSLDSADADYRDDSEIPLSGDDEEDEGTDGIENDETDKKPDADEDTKSDLEETGSEEKEEELATKLPNTATTTYNLMLAGMLLLVAAASILLYKKFRTNS